ncbi:MAG: flagellar assembly protein FliW [Treponema sp.]|nr:flagellar assembly protein FliW [Treponema sp.]
MEVLTKAKGTVEVDEKQLVTFPDGIMGFEQYKKYALINSEYEPFIWLQSLDDANLAFLLVDPFLICSEYEADIDDASLKHIGIQSPEDLVVMTIVTIPSDGSAITANFLGPIVINRKNNKCIQVVLNDSRWTTKFDIVSSLKKKGE